MTEIQTPSQLLVDEWHKAFEAILIVPEAEPAFEKVIRHAAESAVNNASDLMQLLRLAFMSACLGDQHVPAAAWYRDMSQRILLNAVDGFVSLGKPARLN